MITFNGKPISSCEICGETLLHGETRICHKHQRIWDRGIMLARKYKAAHRGTMGRYDQNKIKSRIVSDLNAEFPGVGIYSDTVWSMLIATDYPW